MKVLLCDDHPIVVIANAMLLEAHGHQIVASTYRPDEVRELVLEHQPDLCIIDLLYGETRNSAPALAAIRDVADLTTVLVLSGASDPAQQQAARDAGATAVVSKAWPSSRLMEFVDGNGGVRQRSRRAPVTNTYRLTTRECEVLQCLADGLSTPGIATSLDMRSATARSHVRSLMLKLGVHTRAAAVARGVNEGLVMTG